MKNVLKSVLALIVGIVAGLGVAVACIGLFSDMTLEQFFAKFMSTAGWELVAVCVCSVLAYIVSVLLHVVGHELGHLVFGLLSGYRFVSFRIWNYAFIRQGGKITVRRYGISGTCGQCLMSPPDCPVDKLPVFWYNVGGIVFNLLLSLVTLALWIFSDLAPIMVSCVAVFTIVGFLLALVNAIPFKGVLNDGANMIAVYKSKDARKMLSNALRINALAQEGVSLHDMPEDYFELPRTDVDFTNVFEMQVYNMQIARMLGMEHYDEAYDMCKAVESHKGEVFELFYREAICELLYIALMRGDAESVDSLMGDESLEQYIKQYSKVMSSKQRLMCAIALMREKDETKALEIYRNMKRRKGDYLMQTEVNLDLFLLESLFKKNNVEYGS